MLPALPPLFLGRMSGWLGEQYPAFAAALAAEPCHGLRLNSLKTSPEAFRRSSPFPLGEGVPWCPAAFLLEGQERPGKHPYHQAGLYYLQDPSAMAAAELLSPQPGERVLDLAAAPGGKTTHLASLMQGEGLLVANEIKTKRLNHLVVNVERWGAANVVITNETPERLADHFGAFFDCLLVDAPCSGEGMFRKDPGGRADWSLQMVAGCAVRQTNILRVAAHLVRPGGRLLYSTCTFAPEENEGVIGRFLKEHPDFAVVAIPQRHGFSPGRPDWLTPDEQDPSLSGAVRLFPHRVRGEGHFICLMQRQGGDFEKGVFPREPTRLAPKLGQGWQAFCRETLALDFPAERFQLQGERLYYVPKHMPEMKGLRLVRPGVWLGNFKKDRFEPAHPLALFLREGQARKVLSLSSDSPEMAAYLRGENVASAGVPGWVLVSVDGFPLGWGKRVQGVVKNHYPHSWNVTRD